jgi:threonyl-tRNA synthetase
MAAHDVEGVVKTSYDVERSAVAGECTFPERSAMTGPYLLVVGDKEIDSGTVSVRTRDGEDMGSMLLDEVAELFNRDAERRSRVPETNTE